MIDTKPKMNLLSQIIHYHNSVNVCFPQSIDAANRPFVSYFAKCWILFVSQNSQNFKAYIGMFVLIGMYNVSLVVIPNIVINFQNVYIFENLVEMLDLYVVCSRGVTTAAY